MKDLRFKDSNGNILNVSPIGFFKIPDLEKEYIMYSLTDEDPNNIYGNILLGEVNRIDDYNIIIEGILDSEKEMVVAYYNEISNQLGGANEND